jgi:hypothetical protein
MNKKRKPELGETLYSLNIAYLTNQKERKLVPVKVTKVGNKYFYCREDGSLSVKYNINTWADESDFAQTTVLYENSKEWEDEKESNRIKSKLYHIFGTYGNCEKISLESLKKIEEIIDSEEK